VPGNDESLSCSGSTTLVERSPPWLLIAVGAVHRRDHRIPTPVSRIVLWPSAYLPAFGGVEELTRHLALALVDAGDAVEVWTGTDETSDRPTVETIDGLVVRRFPLPLPAKSPTALARLPLGAVRTLRTMRAAVRTFQPDLFHIQCFGPNGIYAALLSRVSGLPLVLTLQGETVMDDHDIFERSTVMRSGLRMAIRHAATVTGCSQFTLNDAQDRFGLPSGGGQVIFNGVDLAVTPPPAVSDPEPDTPGRFVFAVGRVVDKKGFDLLLKGFSSVTADHPEVDLVIGGDGAALPALKELAAHLGITDRVRFPGRLSRLQVAAFMARADIVVMPSRLEPFGIVVLEAWRAGRPVVATSHGGPREFISDGENGVLVDPFDQAALARTLDGLLADTHRSGLIGAAGRQRVLDFDWPVVAGRYRSSYADVLTARGARAPRP
jgi:glycogen(starch) synthase